MYQALAAYAAAIIADPDRFCAMLQPLPSGEKIPVWFIGNTGEFCTLYENAHKVSILGAMRHAYEVFETDVRAYNSLDRKLRHYTRERYGKTIDQLTHAQAVETLLEIAKH